MTGILLSACTESVDINEIRKELMNVDREFSERSRQVGNHQAFLEYAAPDAVLLKQKHLPIVGKREIREHFELQSDTAYVLTWKPSYARASSSGDFGYTYGIYTLKSKNNPSEINRGTYVTIWKKTKKGKWRFVLDSGNSGLGNSNTE
jgi:ketosteroid isomerase-like protein